MLRLVELPPTRWMSSEPGRASTTSSRGSATKIPKTSTPPARARPTTAWPATANPTPAATATMDSHMVAPRTICRARDDSGARLDDPIELAIVVRLMVGTCSRSSACVPDNRVRPAYPATPGGR